MNSAYWTDEHLFDSADQCPNRVYSLWSLHNWQTNHHHSKSRKAYYIARGGKIIQICSLGERSLISFCPQIFYFFELKTNIKLPLITFKFVQIRIMQYQTLYFTIHRAFTRLLTTCFFFTAVVCRKYCDVCCGGSPVQAVRQHLVPDPTSR